MKYAELHTHLYGCLTSEMLYDIGKKNPSPRWDVFLKDYETAFKKKINPETFFEDYSDPDKFRSLYTFNASGPFLQFQAKFNLIIALVRFTPVEIKSISKMLTKSQVKEGVRYAEYRFMNTPGEGKDNYFFRVKAACEGFQEGEKESASDTQSRLVVSLHRRGNFEEVYSWLKELQKHEPLVKKYLVGIDFCHIEEGNPPIEKKAFLKKIIKDNELDPESALAILYHVGESFTDKTPKSAIRWILEAAEYGAHRLGHCLALGIPAEDFMGKRIRESVSERIAQLSFELKYNDWIREHGITQSEISIINELELLKKKKPEEELYFSMNEKYIVELNTFKRFSVNFLKQKGTCIESCPSSNFLIGGIQNLEQHPLRFFVENDLPVTIGCDDPGIFETNIQKEYELAGKIGIPSLKLDEIREKSFEYTSEKLSGRELFNHEETG